MSINAISGSSSYFGMNSSDMIKPETRQTLEELGIDDTSIKTETQAQNKIQEKYEEIMEQVNETMQAEASQNVQQPQEFSQQYQFSQDSQQTEGVNGADGINQSQQIGQSEGIDQQTGIQNQYTGDEQQKAMVGSGTIQQSQPFELGNDITAMYNKFKLGLI